MTREEFINTKLDYRQKAVLKCLNEKLSGYLEEVVPKCVDLAFEVKSSIREVADAFILERFRESLLLDAIDSYDDKKHAMATDILEEKK